MKRIKLSQLSLCVRFKPKTDLSLLVKLAPEGLKNLRDFFNGMYSIICKLWNEMDAKNPRRISLNILPLNSRHIYKKLPIL